MGRQLKLKKFRDLDINDPFFDSLKISYREFPTWFASKRDEDLYVVDDDIKLSGMVYLKIEHGPVSDITPILGPGIWLKVGTLKIEAMGTKLGERVLKKIFDTAISVQARGIYVTVFSEHQHLIELLCRYGFQRHGTKGTQNGQEIVLVRSLEAFQGDIRQDYPFVHVGGRRFWLLAIYPEYHSRLLPDSILKNEPKHLVEDVSYTNTIHKVYVAKLRLTRMSRGDVVVFYRTTDGKGPAYFRSVVTSVCVVEDVRRKKDFLTAADYIAYAKSGSVFKRRELAHQWRTWRQFSIAKLTYNFAFPKRTIRGRLLDEVGIPEHPRWDLKELSGSQFEQICQLGGTDARLVVY